MTKAEKIDRHALRFTFVAILYLCVRGIVPPTYEPWAIYGLVFGALMRPAMMMKIIIVFFDINVDRLHVPCAVLAHR